MRHVLMALAAVVLCPAIFVAQSKTLPQAANGEALAAAPAITSICDSNTANVAANCGFENGDFSNWAIHGPTDFINVDPSAVNSGTEGALFGTILDYTYLTQSLPAPTSDGVNYHVEYWLANQVGGTGTFFDVYWSADGTFDDYIELGGFTDADPFDWTLYTFGPLPSQSGVQPAIQFQFRHDPDFFWLDDLDVEVTSSSPASQAAARQASHSHSRIAPAGRFAQVTPGWHPARTRGVNAFGWFGFRSPADMFRSLAQKATHPTPRLRQLSFQ